MVQCPETTTVDGVVYRCANRFPEYRRGEHKGVHTAPHPIGQLMWGTPRPEQPPQPPSAKQRARALAAMNPGAHLPERPTALQRALAESGNTAAFMAGARFILDGLDARATALINHPNDELFYGASNAAEAARELIEEVNP